MATVRNCEVCERYRIRKLYRAVISKAIFENFRGPVNMAHFFYETNPVNLLAKTYGTAEFFVDILSDKVAREPVNVLYYIKITMYRDK